MAVFGISLFLAVKEISPYVREADVNRQLARQVKNRRQRDEPMEAAAEDDREGAADLPVIQPLPQYAELYEINSDLAGWLWIEGTKIDYPVMYTPEEPEHYLHRDYYGNQAYSGCLFIGEGYCMGGGNTIIYGHNMRDGSMLAGLLAYASQEFADAHPLICYDTVFEEGVYQAVAAFYCDLDEEGPEAFAYYKYPDLSSEDVFQDYIDRMNQKTVIRTGQELRYGDQLITLSTCSYHVKNGRFVVTAKKVETAKK